MNGKILWWGLSQERNGKFLFIFAGRDLNKTKAVSVVNTTCGFVAPAFKVLSLLVSFLQSRDEGAVSTCREHSILQNEVVSNRCWFLHMYHPGFGKKALLKIPLPYTTCCISS